MCNLRVILFEDLLLSCVPVERTVVSFRMTVLGAEDVAAFAWSLNKSDFTVAFPALVSVSLYFGLFFLLLLLHFFIFHLYIGFSDWLRINAWLCWLFRLFNRFFSRLLLRYLRRWRDGICHFLDKLLDWRSSRRVLLLFSLLLFEALRTEIIRILSTIESFAIITESKFVCVVRRFHGCMLLEIGLIEVISWLWDW